MVSLREVSFGNASAETESKEQPVLLLDGFLRIRNQLIERLVTDSPYFLVLGRKGSGKSAIAEHLRLRSEHESLLFVTIVPLLGFPFQRVQPDLSGDDSDKLPNGGWSWILNYAVLHSILRDNGLQGAEDRQFEQLLDIVASWA